MHYQSKKIDQFKIQNSDVISILDEIAAKRVEIVDKTLFDFMKITLFIIFTINIWANKKL